MIPIAYLPALLALEQTVALPSLDGVALSRLIGGVSPVSSPVAGRDDAWLAGLVQMLARLMQPQPQPIPEGNVTPPQPAPDANLTPPKPSGQSAGAPAGYHTIKGAVPSGVVAKAKSLLSQPMGSETPFELDGKRYLARLEHHYHPPGYQGGPNGWHKGVSVYEAN